VLALAEALKREKPGRTAAQVRRILQLTAGWAPSDRTLQRLFERLELNAPAPGQEEQRALGRFECTRPNEMWTGDTLHGPVIAGGKSYLFCFIDDHCAPRGASLYSRFSRDGLGRRFVGLMALPESER
jgi:putative transposase